MTPTTHLDPGSGALVAGRVVRDAAVMKARPILVGGQRAWLHDGGFRTPAGSLFHTFDHLDVGAGLPPRKVHVRLPASASDPRRRFRVVVMHDGDTSFWPGGAFHQCWRVEEALARLGDLAEDLIVVAVHPHDRNAEYTHVDWSGGRRPWGKAGLYTRYLARHLVPFIDTNYPTIPTPDARAVVGSSHGGLVSFFAATRHPDVFGFAGAMSPSFFSGIEPPPYGPGEAPLRSAPIVSEVWPVLTSSSRPRVWIDWGLVRHGGDHNAVVEHLAAKRGQEMARLLADHAGYVWHDVTTGEQLRADATLWTLCDERGAHDERSWGARLPWVLQAFMGRSLSGV
jgi:hypothetical protein